MTTSNFDRLATATDAGRRRLVSLPIVQQALAGTVTRDLYLRFLTQAYHHVRHTVPLLMAVASRLPARLRWLQHELVHYAEEELGHDEWILQDIEAAGGDAQLARETDPAIATDAMVAYAYDTVGRRDAVGFFGMVYVLEGTSVALALQAASSLQRSLALPDRAFTYLRSHGRLDQEHVGHLRALVDRLDSGEDLPAVIRCAAAMFELYANVFRSLENTSDEN